MLGESNAAVLKAGELPREQSKTKVLEIVAFHSKSTKCTPETAKPAWLDVGSYLLTVPLVNPLSLQKSSEIRFI